jgi:hypothetical protein
LPCREVAGAKEVSIVDEELFEAGAGIVGLRLGVREVL